MDLSKIGGDSQNTMPIAINAGLSARKIAQASIDPAAKFSTDAFMASLKNGGLTKAVTDAKNNLPISDALQQQSALVRFASKIPFVKNWLGSEGQMNGLIGGLNDGKGGFLSKMLPGSSAEANVAMNKVELTRLLYNAKTPQEIEGIVKSAKIADPAVAKQLIASAQERLASAGASSVATEVGTTAAKSAATTAAQVTATDIMTEAGGFTLKKGFSAMPSAEAITKALASEEPAKALGKLGFYAKDAKGLVAKFATSTTETTVKSAAGEVVQKTTTSTATVATQAAEKAGGVKRLLGKIFGGAKGNFVVAGIFSLASNTMQLAQGKMNFKQWLGLTVLDTAAYGGIGWGSAAAGAALGTMVGGPIGTVVGFLGGLALGFVGGSLYEKFVRNPVKGMLGPTGGAAPYTPNTASNNPADPYSSANNYQPANLPPGTNVSFEQAMAQIDRMGHS